MVGDRGGARAPEVELPVDLITHDEGTAAFERPGHPLELPRRERAPGRVRGADTYDDLRAPRNLLAEVVQVQLEIARRGQAVEHRPATRHPHDRRIGDEPRVREEHLVAVVHERREGEVERLLRARGNDHTVGSSAQRWILAGHPLSQCDEARVRRVAVPLVLNRADRGLAHDVGRREIGLAEAQVDAPRGSAVEELADRRLLDAAQPPRRLEPAHRSASSSRVAASVRSSRYFTITGAYSDKPSAFASVPFAARAPGTTTAPAGISRTPPALGLRYTRSRARS